MASQKSLAPAIHEEKHNGPDGHDSKGDTEDRLTAPEGEQWNRQAATHEGFMQQLFGGEGFGFVVGIDHVQKKQASGR